MEPRPPDELFEEIFRRHGHRCPMSTLGGLLGWAARRHFDQAPAEDLQGIYYSRTCAVDGVALSTGCDPDSGRLLVLDQGRHALVLVSAADGRGVEVVLRPAALAVAWEYRQCSERLEEDRERLSADEIEEREVQKARVLDTVIARLRGMEEERLMERCPAWIDLDNLREGR